MLQTLQAGEELVMRYAFGRAAGDVHQAEDALRIDHERALQLTDVTDGWRDAGAE